MANIFLGFLMVAGLLALLAEPAPARTTDSTITKTGPETAIVGQTYPRYDITVTNTASYPITISAGTVLARDALTNGTTNPGSLTGRRA